MFMLLGDQIIPNLIPFLQLNIDGVVLVTTRDLPLKYATENLYNYLLQSGLSENKIWYCKGTKTDLATTVSACNNLIEQLKTEIPTELEFIFNMSSGTKIMALAFYRLTEETGGRLIYLDSDRDLILELLPEVKEHNLGVQLKVADYLAAHGYTIIRDVKSSDSSTYINKRKAAKILAQALPTTVSTLAKSIQYKGQLSTLNVESVPQALELAKCLEGILWHLHISSENKITIEFLHEADFFPGGKWLEYYALDCAQEVNDKIGYLLTDVKAGLELSSRNGLSNEIDLAFTWGHHFALCSCKVGHKAESEWLYDLNDRARSLGSFCRKILLVNFDTHGATQFRERAKRDNIILLDGRDLLKLTEKLQYIVKPH